MKLSELSKPKSDQLKPMKHKLLELRDKRAKLVARLTEIHASFAGIKNAMKNGGSANIKHSAIYHRKEMLTRDLQATTAGIADLNSQIANIGDKEFADIKRTCPASLVRDCQLDEMSAEKVLQWFRINECSIVNRNSSHA